MFEVTVHTTISASHHLRGYQGKCERIHGHNWKIEATAGAEALDGLGMAIDFGVLREHLRAVTEPLDHSDLNGLPEFSSCNPSSENLARLVFERLAARLQGAPVRLVRVRVWETEGSVASYRVAP
jgi:6-pyruvoyltetrahydropterin/6-carboxytetrahydropterin synthase